MFGLSASVLFGALLTCNAAQGAPFSKEKSLVARDSSSLFQFYDIPTATATFVGDVSMGIDYEASVTLTNTGDGISIPITGNTNINGTIYTNANFSLTDPAIFLTDGEYYPAAARLAFTNGDTMSFLFILTAGPDLPNTPVINTMLQAVGDIPSAGNTTTITGLDFTNFISQYVIGDVFYTVIAGETYYYVRQLPLSMDLSLWRELKKAIQVSGAAVKDFTKYY